MAVVLAAASAFLLTRLRTQLWDAVDDGLDARAAIMLADVVEDPQQIGTKEGVIDEAERIAQILDDRGEVLESTRFAGTAPLVASVRLGNFEKGNTRLLTARSENGYIVVVGSSVEDAQRALATLTRLLVFGGPIVLVVTALAVWALVGVALRPVERLRSEAEALSFGIDGHRLRVPPTHDEIARLAETLNVMLSRLEESLERERRFVDDASHELRTPLAVLKTELELALRRSRSRDELEGAVRSAAEEVETLSRLAERLLILARADRGLLPAKRTRVDLSELVGQVAAGYDGVRLAGSPQVFADVDPLLLRQALSNLIENALRHTTNGEAVTVTVSPGAEIVVSDSGPGFDPELLATVFEPFTQSDGARGRASGTGLGLAIVKAIAEAHGGTVEATNGPEGGASVSLRIPGKIPG